MSHDEPCWVSVSVTIRTMTRVLFRLGTRVLIALAVGVAAAAGLAALRGGEFSHEIRISLWIVGGLMLGMAVASLSPSTRHAQGELSNVFIGRRFLGADERGGAGATVVLAISGFCMFGIALLVS
jgi:Na+-translocating ferredoxin:NAD+ oxidoreductase RnfD subunit